MGSAPGGGVTFNAQLEGTNLMIFSGMTTFWKQKGLR